MTDSNRWLKYFLFSLLASAALFCVRWCACLLSAEAKYDAGIISMDSKKMIAAHFCFSDGLLEGFSLFLLLTLPVLGYFLCVFLKRRCCRVNFLVAFYAENVNQGNKIR